MHTYSPYCEEYLSSPYAADRDPSSGTKIGQFAGVVPALLAYLASTD